VTPWQWVLVGGAAWLALSFVVTLATAMTFGQISRRMNELEPDWTFAPLARERNTVRPGAATLAEAEEPTTREKRNAAKFATLAPRGSRS
jgi:hypothetical protein